MQRSEVPLPSIQGSLPPQSPVEEVSLLSSAQALTSRSFLHQVLQGETNGIMFHRAGDEMGYGPLHRAPLNTACLAEVFQHGVDD